MDLPGNSNAEKEPKEPAKAPAEKKVERVTSSDAKVRKPSLGKRFGRTFVGGDGKSAMNYVVFSVLVPAAKEALAEAGAQGIERLIFGESRRRASTKPQTGAAGYVNYSAYAAQGRQSMDTRPSMSRQARAAHNFDEILLQERGEAELVLERLFDLVKNYGSASVADLYELVGVRPKHTDIKWGWVELPGANIMRTRAGFLLDLPDPIQLG